MSLAETEARSPKQLGHPDTSTIFVLGLIGLVALPLAVCAWIFGNRVLRAYDAEPGRWAHRRWVEIGRTLGMIGVPLGILGLLTLLVLTVF